MIGYRKSNESEAKRLHSEGLPLHEIGKRLNISTSSANRYVKPELRKETKNTNRSSSATKSKVSEGFFDEMAHQDWLVGTGKYEITVKEIKQ